MMRRTRREAGGRWRRGSQVGGGRRGGEEVSAEEADVDASGVLAVDGEVHAQRGARVGVKGGGRGRRKVERGRTSTHRAWGWTMQAVIVNAARRSWTEGLVARTLADAVAGSSPVDTALACSWLRGWTPVEGEAGFTRTCSRRGGGEEVGRSQQGGARGRCSHEEGLCRELSAMREDRIINKMSIRSLGE